jgi:ubiquinone/menaquinone biosynthesis C-methylase UbiE
MDAAWQAFFRHRATVDREFSRAEHDDYWRCDYDSRRSFEWRRRSILGWIGPRRGAMVLDVGCGPGRFAQPLTTDNHVVGVDFVGGMLVRAARCGLEPLGAHAGQLPLAEGAFDLVLCIEVLQCVDHWQAVVKELARVTRPGGSVVVATLADSLGRRVWYGAARALGRQGDLVPRLFRADDIVETLRGECMQAMQVLHLYYPVTYRQVAHHPLGRRSGVLPRLMSSSFAVRATK